MFLSMLQARHLGSSKVAYGDIDKDEWLRCHGMPCDEYEKAQQLLTGIYERQDLLGAGALRGALQPVCINHSRAQAFLLPLIPKGGNSILPTGSHISESVQAPNLTFNTLRMKKKPTKKSEPLGQNSVADRHSFFNMIDETCFSMITHVQ